MVRRVNRKSLPVLRRLAVACFLLASESRAADWPQFLGPDRNGTSPDPVRSTAFAGEPAVRWKIPVGSGFAGPVISGEKVIVFHRQGAEELVQALDARSGKAEWTHRHPTAYVDDQGFDNGPRGTPAVSDGRVFVFGAEGRLVCLQLADGKKLWELDTQEQLRADQGFFGPACSPLVADGRVLLNVGGADGTGVVAFDAASGRLLWKQTDDEAGYASPVLAAKDGRSRALFYTREGLVGVEPVTGRLLFTHRWRSRMSASVNAASPLVVGDEVLLTASYGTGAMLVRLHADRVETLWAGDESLSAHYATPVVKDGFVYGFHGRQESRPALRCIEWRTGRVRWSEESFGAGTLALAAGQLVILRENGELVLAPASPDAFKPVARAQVIGSCRAAFALAGGFLYARDQRQLVCVDLRP